jgi:NAD(P)H-flavin reductase
VGESPFFYDPHSVPYLRKYSDRSEIESGDIESKHAMMVGSKTTAGDRSHTNSGLTLFVRKSKGLTGFLKANDRLLTLVEGPYPTNPTNAVLQSDRLLLIGGGIGITGLLPFLWCHPNLKLFYSIKTADKCLVDSLTAVVDEVCEKEIAVGNRLNVNALLRDEVNLGWSKVAVVVCGPVGMCDDIRAVMARLGREIAGRCSLELEVDAFFG